MAKRKPLVCEFLENVSRAVLEEHQDIIQKFVRGRPGVYALYRRKKLYYVGLARNLRNRLNHHLKDRHGLAWDRFSVYLTIGDEHMRELESLIVRIVRPRGNKQIGKFAKAENLQQKLWRLIMDYHKLRLSEMVGRHRESEEDHERPRRRADRDGGEGSKPPLAQYITRPIQLRRRYKGTMLKAKVRRDGMIRSKGRLYRTPSLAAKAAMCRQSACNGWKFWTYERAPGDWVNLDELRR